MDRQLFEKWEEIGEYCATLRNIAPEIFRVMLFKVLFLLFFVMAVLGHFCPEEIPRKYLKNCIISRGGFFGSEFMD